MNWIDAPDVKQDLERIVHVLDMDHIDTAEITCYRSKGSTARAYARIWSLPKVFQMALELKKPHYVIEVLSEHYDKLSYEQKQRTLLHELLHIPKKFSGGLVAHKGSHHNLERNVTKLFKELQKHL